MNTYKWKLRNRSIGLFLLLVLVLVACTPADGVVRDTGPGLDASYLPGTAWRPTYMSTAQETTSIDVEYLVFDEEGEYRGRLGARDCGNYYFGRYSASGRKIEISHRGQTAMGCYEELGAGDGDEYLVALSQAHSFELTAESLVIYYGDGGEIHFAPTSIPESPAGAAAAPTDLPSALPIPNLDNTSWAGLNLLNEAADVRIGSLAVAGVQLQFEKGRISGFAGCQSFVVPYSQEGEKIAVDAAGLEFSPPDCADEIRGRLQANLIEVLLAADSVQSYRPAIGLSGPKGSISLVSVTSALPAWPGREGTVVWAVLRHAYPELFDGVLVVNNELAFNRPGVSLSETKAALEAAWEMSLEATLWAHFEERNESPGWLADNRLVDFPLFNDGLTFNSSGLQERTLTFSRVGFSEDGRQALFYVADEQERMINGRYFLLVWEEDWRVVAEATLWTETRVGWPTPTPSPPTPTPYSGVVPYPVSTTTPIPYPYPYP